MNRRLVITFIIFIIGSVVVSQDKIYELMPGDYILFYNGNTSYSAAIKVIVKMEGQNIKILVPKPYNVSKLLKYEGHGTYSMDTNDPMGNGKITGKIISKTEFLGTFSIKFSSEAKKRFFTNKDETGEFKLIPFSEKKFRELKKEINDKLYNVKKYKSLEEMAKVSPYGRQLLARQEKVKNQRKKTFYGRVIDQYNDPVVGAKVEMRVSDTTAIVLTYTDWPSKIYYCTTDKNGCFSLGNMKSGYRVTIKNVEKEGYTDKLDYYNALSLWGKKYTTPADPIIIKVRKKGQDPTYLIKNIDFNLKLKPNTEQLYSFIDLEEEWEDAGHNRDYKKDFLPNHYDIKVNTVLNKEKGEWIITFSASGNNGGFIIRDDFLSEAPEQGYKKELNFYMFSDKNKNRTHLEGKKNLKDLEGKYLYVKSRKPVIYTRIKIGDCDILSEWLQIDTSTATNPYGERNLEYNDELPLDISDECSSIVDKYFLTEKLPPKPNIKKNMIEFKKTHKRVKNKYYGNYEWIKK